MKSMRIPFRFEGGGVGQTYEPTQIAEQKIVNCLVIAPPERVGLPRYGAGATRLVMENLDELVISDFITDAKLELASTISEVSVTTMSIENENVEQEGQANLNVKYRLGMDVQESELVLTLDADIITEETGI